MEHHDMDAMTSASTTSVESDEAGSFISNVIIQSEVSAPRSTAHKLFVLVACACAAVFLFLKKSVEEIEEFDGRPIHVLLRRPGEARAVGKTFPRESCKTLGDLKALISRSGDCGEPRTEDQVVVYNGRELRDDSMDLNQCLPGVTGGEDWVDQRVYPNHWSVVHLKQPKRRVKRVAWGFCKSYEIESPGLALVAFIALCTLGSL